MADGIKKAGSRFLPAFPDKSPSPYLQLLHVENPNSA